MSELDQLRARMRDIDAEIISQIGERLTTARRIGELKRASGVPLRDWDVERRVLDNAQQRAVERDVPPDVARRVLSLLLHESRVAQERGSYTHTVSSEEAEDVLVVGGAGRMGRWMMEFLANQGHRVRGFDPRVTGSGHVSQRTNGPFHADHERIRFNATPDQSSFEISTSLDVRDVGVVCISTPMDVIPAVLEQLAEQKFTGVAFDIASLKAHLKPAIADARRRGVRVTSLHPMFGPATRTLADQVVCACDCGDADATARAAAFFRGTAATVIEMSIDDHDQIAAYVLGLSHLTSIVFTQVLRSCGRPFRVLDRIGSTTFHSQMRTTSTVIQEDPNLYFSIQKLNAFMPEVSARFEQELRKINGLVHDNDAASFHELMSDCCRWVHES